MLPFTIYGLALNLDLIMSSVGMENLSLKYSGCEILGYSVSTNVLLNSGVKSSDVMYVCHDKKTVCAIIVLCNGNSFILLMCYIKTYRARTEMLITL